MPQSLNFFSCKSLECITCVPVPIHKSSVADMQYFSLHD